MLSESTTSNLLESVFDNVSALLVVIDGAGKLVFSNRAFATLFGDNREQIPIHLTDWARVLLTQGYRFQDNHGHDIIVDGSKVMRALLGEQVEPCDFRIIFPDGSWKWMHASIHRFSVVGLAGVLVIATDETVYAELQHAATRVERLETLGAVSRALAHDFNNILEVISSNVYLALADAGVPETTRMRLEAISAAPQKATGLVRRLMQFGRPHVVEMRPVQINDLIIGVLQLVRPLFRDEIRVRTALRPDLPMIDADPLEMDQLLVNLIVNATDAMSQGGDLVISTEVKESDEGGMKSVQAKRRLVLISVSDTGIGISPGVQSQIFEPFFTTKTRGTGLGLSSVYGIVRQHGGDITVQSKPAKGTTFTVSLPAK
ncbi:MAG TPA: ATP-binding protein [Terriglobales bacterium]|nr:ATP-binding protein [Terriglobales bacterium]